MRLLMVFVCVLAAACLVSAIPAKRITNPGTKGLPIGRTPEAPNRDLKKGEYVCNGKICRLEPGIPPGGCVECQYPVKLFRNN